jgi:hypothetical protein
LLNYDDLVELASLCARNSRITTSRDVADELWRMAKEYQAQAAKLGVLPELGTNRRCQIRCDDSRSSKLRARWCIARVTRRRAKVMLR